MAAWRDDEIDSVRRERIKQVFDKALDLPVAERIAFVSSTCGNDQQVYEAVRELLGNFEAAGSLLDAPFFKIHSKSESRVQSARFSVGEVIASRFVVTRVIGHGGMGEV